MRNRESGKERYAERQRSEQHGLILRALKLNEIDLETDEKHEEKLADGGEETYNGTMFANESEAVGTEQKAGQQKPNDSRQSCAFRYSREQKNQEHYDRKFSEERQIFHVSVDRSPRG
jgi:hypothetical protein